MPNKFGASSLAGCEASPAAPSWPACKRAGKSYHPGGTSIQRQVRTGQMVVEAEAIRCTDSGDKGWAAAFGDRRCRYPVSQHFQQTSPAVC